MFNRKHFPAPSAMLFWTIFLVSAAFVISDCPQGYTDTGFGSCYKIYTNTKNRNDAARACQAEGAYLGNIKNAFANGQIRSDAAAAGVLSLWLGLTCFGTTYNTCQYDGSNTRLTSTDYTNFYPGNPDPDVGDYIYMGIVGGIAQKWLSDDFTTQRAYICMVQKETNSNSCGVGYTLFNNMCYQVIAYADEAAAETFCENDCGHITSILSHDENVFVQSLAFNYTSTEYYVRIGLKEIGTTNNYQWEDGTPLGVYSNFGMTPNSNFGNCVGMALKQDLVKPGEWTNNKCSSLLLSICKREPDSSNCYHGEPTLGPRPTITPFICPQQPYVYHDNGTIYSPGYPSTTVATTCEYVIYGPPNTVVRFSFKELNMDCNSEFYLYNDITNPKPFLTITKNVNLDSWYYSTENEMKIVFHSGGGGGGCAVGDYWQGVYQSVRDTSIATTFSPTDSICNYPNVRYGPGTITSPNYPNNYPNNANCTYFLGATGTKHVVLKFNEIVTETSVDIITIYDGPDDNFRNSPILARLSGTNPNVPYTYSSSGNRMTVNFITDSMDNAKGFSADFTSSN